MAEPDLPVPLTAFNFAVEIQLPGVAGVSRPLCAGHFFECDGLEISFDIKTIREGGNNHRQIRLAGPSTMGTLSLKRGMTRAFDLWTWVTNVQRDPALRADAVVVMFDSEKSKERKVMAHFTLECCLPVKIKAPALHAKDGLIAVEELQVAYEALTMGTGRGGQVE